MRLLRIQAEVLANMQGHKEAGQEPDAPPEDGPQREAEEEQPLSDRFEHAAALIDPLAVSIGEGRCHAGTFRGSDLTGGISGTSGRPRSSPGSRSWASIGKSCRK